MRKRPMRHTFREESTPNGYRYRGIVVRDQAYPKPAVIIAECVGVNYGKDGAYTDSLQLKRLMVPTRRYL